MEIIPEIFALFEDTVPDYTEWGWIDQNGRYYDGNRMDGVGSHLGLLKKLTGANTYPQAWERNWVRFYVLKGVVTLEFMRTPRSLHAVIEFLKKTGEPHDRYFFDVWKTPKQHDERATQPINDGVADALDYMNELLLRQ